MKRKKGILLAAKFSWGCKRAKQFNISDDLKEYTDSDGKSCSEKEIEKKLEKLYSYIYYSAIAKSNNLEDPFNIKVVKAHWIGNKLLEKIKKNIAKEIFKKMVNHHDKVVLAWVMEPLLKEKRAHHNDYARHNPLCSVALKDGYFYHLQEKRLKASSQDMKNFNKYGGKE